MTTETKKYKEGKTIRMSKQNYNILVKEAKKNFRTRMGQLDLIMNEWRLKLENDN